MTRVEVNQHVLSVEERVTRALDAEFPEPESHRIIVIIDEPDGFAYLTYGDGKKVRRPEADDIDVMRFAFRVYLTLWNDLSKRWQRKARRALQREWDRMGGHADDWENKP